MISHIINISIANYLDDSFVYTQKYRQASRLYDKFENSMWSRIFILRLNAVKIFAYMQKCCRDFEINAEM